LDRFATPERRTGLLVIVNVAGDRGHGRGDGARVPLGLSKLALGGHEYAVELVAAAHNFVAFVLDFCRCFGG
jgi:hypothetical protein